MSLNFEEVYSPELDKVIKLGGLASVGDYTHYDNKVWRVVALHREGPKFSKFLKRELAGETIWVSGLEAKTLKSIVEPSGYIRV